MAIVSKIQFLFVGGLMDGKTVFVNGITESTECIRHGERYVALTMLEHSKLAKAPIGIYIMAHESMDFIDVMQCLVRKYNPAATIDIPDSPFSKAGQAALKNGIGMGKVTAEEVAEEQARKSAQKAVSDSVDRACLAGVDRATGPDVSKIASIEDGKVVDIRTVPPLPNEPRITEDKV